MELSSNKINWEGLHENQTATKQRPNTGGGANKVAARSFDRRCSPPATAAASVAASVCKFPFLHLRRCYAEHGLGCRNPVAEKKREINRISDNCIVISYSH